MALTYLVVGVAWILLGDLLVGGTESTVEVTKGLAFVLLSSGLLWRLLLLNQRHLEATYRRFAYLVDHVEGYGIIALDGDGRVAAWNTGAEDLTGLRASGALGRHIGELQVDLPPDRQAWTAILADARRDGVVEIHRALRRTDGARRLVAGAVTSVPDAGTNAGGYAIVFRDVTREQEAEEAQARLAAIVEHTGLAATAVDRDGFVVTWNAAAERLTKLPAADAVGRQFLELPARWLRAEYEEMLSSAYGGEARHVETRVVRRDGTSVPVGMSASPIRDRSGEVIGVSMLGRDISARLRIEHELRHSVEHFRRLADIAEEGMYRVVLEPEPRYEFVNPAFERSTGYRLEDFQRDPQLHLKALHPDDRHVMDGFRSASGAPGPAEVRWQRSDGTTVWLSLREVPIVDGDGRLVAVHGVALDVTQRRLQEQALRQALEQEREATERLLKLDAMRRTFLQAVSHELRTPLTSVVGFATTLRDHRGRLPDQDALRLLERLLANSRRLQGLLDDLLDVDRLSRGIGSAEREWAQVADVVRGVLEQTGRLSYVRFHADGPCPASVDVPKVERIVDNLVANATKHAGPDATIAVGVYERDGVIVLQVADNGPGVPDELKSTIFEPFEQGPASERAARPGTGIGLALVRQFVELHGGQVWVEDAEGGGARFVVELPAEPDEAAVLAAAGVKDTDQD